MSVRSTFNYAWTSGWTGVVSAWVVLGQIPRADPERIRRQTRTWAEVVVRTTGVEVRTFGAERLDPNGTYVLMANHQSHVDIPTLFKALPMVPGFLAKAELRKVPLFGRAMEAAGHVFVERGKRGKAAATIERAAKDIAASGSIVIFPEGTRSRRREVMPFKKGGFHLARLARVPIVPIGLRGTADILPKHGKHFLPGVCEVHIGEPIEPRDGPAEELMEEVRAEICRLAALPAAADRSGA